MIAVRDIQVGDDLTIHETRRIASVGREEILRAIEAGVLRSHYVNGRRRVRWNDAMTFRGWYWCGGRDSLRSPGQ
jgi:hypothetical protein